MVVEAAGGVAEVDAGGYLLQDDLFENIAADVAGWLNDRNGHNGHYYDTIMEAMEDTDYFINKTLVGQYTTEESFGDSGQPPEYWSNFWL